MDTEETPLDALIQNLWKRGQKKQRETKTMSNKENTLRQDLEHIARAMRNTICFLPVDYAFNVVEIEALDDVRRAAESLAMRAEHIIRQFTGEQS